MSIKIGLIARAETSRGLAIQSKNFFDHMPVARTLLVLMPRPDCDLANGWYPGCTQIQYNDLDHTLPKEKVMDWMEGLDVIFTVETPYDWNLPDWARSIGVKTVIQGNPEFFRHGRDDVYRAHPDAWWWPTSWRLEHLPFGPVVPVPMPDETHVKARGTSGRLSFLHVVGKRAYADRNGTDIVIDALRAVTAEIDFHIAGFGWELPDDIPAPKNVNLTVERTGVMDRWEMYHDQNILILPRRYGGLCLPALEAAACGIGVVMPAESPNWDLAQYMISCQRDRWVNFAAGKIRMADVNHRDLAHEIDMLAHDRGLIRVLQDKARAEVPRWGTMRAVYMNEFEQVLSAG